MTMKALAKATAMSLEGYVINMSWLTLEPNVRYPQTPDPAHTETTLQVSNSRKQTICGGATDN